MKKLKEYADQIHNTQPQQLYVILQNMTHDYGEVCDDLIPLERKKVDFFLAHKGLDQEKPKSDTTLDMMWKKDGDGILQMRMEMYKKALEKMMSNVKAMLREAEVQSRNDH